MKSDRRVIRHVIDPELRDALNAAKECALEEISDLTEFERVFKRLVKEIIYPIRYGLSTVVAIEEAADRIIKQVTTG